MPSKSKQKGDVLEKAVELIERTILGQRFKGQDNKITIERGKVEIIDGIRYEVDLFVELDHGAGYKPLFIFECKNWDKNVGRGEIVNFADKVDAFRAQKGFFIAKGFGKYARKQAEKCLRIELLLAKDTYIDPTPFPNRNVFFSDRKNSITSIEFESKHKEGEKHEPKLIDKEKIKIVYQGAEVNPADFINNKLINPFWNRWTPIQKEEGTYPIKIEEIIEFGDGELIINDKVRICAKILFEFNLTITKLRVVSWIDVEGRGRVIDFKPLSFPEGTTINFSEIFVMDIKQKEARG